MRDVILESPPFTEDWGGLDGILYERYIKEAKNSNKKRMVQNHYMMSSIDILDEVRKCGSREIISDIEEAIKTKSTKGHSKNSGANKNSDISVSI
nr:15595_t:CDS:2 [Entrophospora candida]